MGGGTNTSCRFGFPEAIAPFGAYYNCRCLEGGTAYLSNNQQQINIIYKFISGRYPNVVIKPRKFIGKRIL